MGHLLESVTPIPAFELNASGFTFEHSAINTNVEPSWPHIGQNTLHGVNPACDFGVSKSLVMAIGDVPTSQLLPTGLDFHSLREGKRFTAFNAREQPPTATPWAGKLRRIGDVPIATPAERHQVVVGFFKVNNLLTHLVPLLDDWLTAKCTEQGEHEQDS